MLLSSCLLMTAAPAMADVKPPDEVSQGLVKIAEPIYQALKREANKDPRIAAQVAAYSEAVKRILANKNLKPSERDLQLKELARRMDPVYKTLVQRAGIDERTYKEAGEQHIRRTAARHRKHYAAKYLGYLGWYWKLISPPTRTLQPANKTITLSVPFPFEQSQTNGSGDNTVNKEAGTYKAKAEVYLAGGHENSAGLAHFFVVDANYRSIDVSAALSETGWRVYALADLFAVAFGASAKSRIDIFTNNQVICSEEVEHGNVLAPVLFIAEQTGLDNIVTTCELENPIQNDEIVIRATSVAGVWGGGLGFAQSRVEGKPRDLKLLLHF